VTCLLLMGAATFARFRRSRQKAPEHEPTYTGRS